MPEDHIDVPTPNAARKAFPPAETAASDLARLLARALELPGVAAEVSRQLGRLPIARSEPFVDAATVAGALGIPVKTVRQYARERRLPCYHVGRGLRFRQSEVEQAVLDGRLAAQ